MIYSSRWLCCTRHNRTYNHTSLIFHAIEVWEVKFQTARGYFVNKEVLVKICVAAVLKYIAAQ